MSTKSQSAGESVDSQKVKALTGVMTVLGDLPEVRNTRDRYAVVTESGSQYEVDVIAETCTCPHYEDEPTRCKHVHRARYAVGLAEIPEWVSESEVDSELGAFVPSKYGQE